MRRGFSGVWMESLTPSFRVESKSAKRVGSTFQDPNVELTLDKFQPFVLYG